MSGFRASGFSSNAYEYSFNTQTKSTTRQITLLSILNGDGGGGASSTSTTTLKKTITSGVSEVHSPKPVMPREAFEALLLSDSPIQLYQKTPRSMLNSRALTTPSVERLTEYVAPRPFGAVGEGRPSITSQRQQQKQPFLTSPNLDTPPPNYSAIGNGYCVERTTLCCLDSTQPTFVDDFIIETNEISPLLSSISLKSPQEALASNPIPRSFPPSDAAYREHYRLYRLIDSVLSSPSLRARTPEEICHFFLSLAESWDFKMTIYSVIESLLDNAIQAGYPQNYDLVFLCSVFMKGIGKKWRGQTTPTIYQEFMADALIDIFKDAWTTLLARGPSRYPLLDRICAFYGELYFKGVLSLAQYLLCYEVIRKTAPARRPPMALFYFTSGEMKTFEEMPL